MHDNDEDVTQPEKMIGDMHLALTQSQENLFVDLQRARNRSYKEKRRLVDEICDFDHVINPYYPTDIRIEAACALTEIISIATDEDLFDIARIIDVPTLREAANDEDETVRRPIQGLINTLALRVSKFLRIDATQAQADPDLALDALHQIKTGSQAMQGNSAISLQRAMIDKRNSFSAGPSG